MRPRSPIGPTEGILLLATVVGILVQPACVPSQTPTAPPPSATLVPHPSPSPVSTGPLQALFPELPETLDPLAPSGDARALRSLYLPGLWVLDDRLEPHPALAGSVPALGNGGISEDGRTLTLHLRPDLHWSDGVPLTAADVVFTWEYAAREGIFPYASFVERVVPVDEWTVRVEFSRPFAPWPAYLFTFVLPRHVLESGRAGAWRAFPAVGSGPYVPVYWEGGGLVMAANPFWPGPLPADRLVVRRELDARARRDIVARGEADIALFPAPEGLPEAGVPEGTTLYTSPSGYVETLFFNLDPRTGHPALQSERVRSILVNVLDRPSLCRALNGPASSAWTFYSGTIWERPGWTPSDLPPAQARRLLDEAGWRDADGDGVREWHGIPLRLRYAVPAGEVDRRAVQAQVSQRWREIGVAVDIVEMDRPWSDPGAWDVAQWAARVPGYPDPDDPRWLCREARPGGQNVAGVCDERLDDLIAAQAAAVDPEERRIVLYELQALAWQQAWWAPLCQWEDVWLLRGGLRDLRPWREAPFWKMVARD